MMIHDISPLLTLTMKCSVCVCVVNVILKKRHFKANTSLKGTPRILVKNLETFVCVSPSSMLIWVLQSSQCSKIRVAQHWGRRGANLSENPSAISECKKVSRKFTRNGVFLALFQRFVTSIVVPVVPQ